MSNTQLEALLADEPEAVADEIIRINTEARPFALQVALLVPLIAGLLGLARVVRAWCGCPTSSRKRRSKVSPSTDLRRATSRRRVEGGLRVQLHRGQDLWNQSGSSIRYSQMRKTRSPFATRAIGQSGPTTPGAPSTTTGSGEPHSVNGP